MDFQEIARLLSTHLPDGTVSKTEETLIQPRITVLKEQLIAACQYLYETDGLYFDFLSNITAIDNGILKNSLEVIYNLYSIPYNHHFTIRVELPRTYSDETANEFTLFEDSFIPTIPSLTSIWKTANWHEREAFDLMGIWFDNHPDLRRILLPLDWKGHPLRKDYKNLEIYHGIKVDY